MPTGVYERSKKQKEQARKNIEPFLYKKGDNKGIHPKTEFKKGHKKPSNAYKFPIGCPNYNSGSNKGKHWKIKDTSKMKGKEPWNKNTKGLIKPNSGSFKKGTPIEKHPRWLGGISFEPYSVDWTQTLKRSIRERYHYICQICGKEPSVIVHHIDYNKKNCNPENLITLCRNCHTKTNTNRNYWKEYLMDSPPRRIPHSRQRRNNEFSQS
jgi:5-methylcytosine-specific restriction endonuclease McrA